MTSAEKRDSVKSWNVLAPYEKRDDVAAKNLEKRHPMYWLNGNNVTSKPVKRDLKKRQCRRKLPSSLPAPPSTFKTVAVRPASSAPPEEIYSSRPHSPMSSSPASQVPVPESSAAVPSAGVSHAPSYARSSAPPPAPSSAPPHALSSAPPAPPVSSEAPKPSYPASSVQPAPSSAAPSSAPSSAPGPHDDYVVFWYRTHSKSAIATNDPLPIPNGASNADDNIQVVAILDAPGKIIITSGGVPKTFTVYKGLNNIAYCGFNEGEVKVEVYHDNTISSCGVGSKLISNSITVYNFNAVIGKTSPGPCL
jgi:hypothetical protein